MWDASLENRARTPRSPSPSPSPSPICPGTGTGRPSPICPGAGTLPPSPSPICPESGTLPPGRPRPRFAEIGDQAVVLEYPKGVEWLAQVWSHNSQITRRTGQLCPDTPTFQVPIWLAIAPEVDEEKARNDAVSRGSSREPPWERWLKLDPLFAGCLPSKPLALIGACKSSCQ
jgi:hypothetical protein